MELQALASVVIQKLKDKLPDEITDKKVTVKALEELQSNFADTDEEQRNSREFKSWAEECVKILYDVEETVESFARQNKKGGFLMKHFPVFKNFKAGQNLRSKMKRINSNIERVIHIYPTPLPAVASVVIQKVNDMLPDEITDKKVIVKELEQLQRETADADEIAVKKVIVKALEKLQRKIADADDITGKKVIVKALKKLQLKIADTDEEQRNSKEFKSWVEECLKSLYDVEETVESFSLGIARQNKKGGFLMKHFPVFKNFKAGQNLRSKMKRINSNIERLIHIYPTPLHPCGQMELQAVASVVIQKVNDMLPDEITDRKVKVKALEELQRKISDADEITDKKVIVKALEKMQRKIADADEIMDKKEIVKALEKLQRKIADTDEEQRNSKEFKSWAEECLKSLYDVEETVKSFSLGIARQNKKGGFLMKHFPVFKNFKAGQNLRSKMKRVPSNIERLIHIYPNVGCFGLLTSYVKTQTRPNKCKPILMTLQGFISSQKIGTAHTHTEKAAEKPESKIGRKPLRAVIFQVTFGVSNGVRMI